MLRCGITGHTGTLGKVFIKRKKKFKFIKFFGNITNCNQIERWIKNNNFDLIIHLAAIVPTDIVKKNYSRALKVNYLGTKYLIDSLIRNNIKLKWFFFSSTSHVYKFSKKKINEKSITKPSSKYGLTKLKAENYIKKKLTKKKINHCLGRIFSFTHKNQDVSYLVPKIKKKILSKEKFVEFKNLNHYRDFISVDDICDAIHILWKKKFNGIVNIASGKKILLKNIVKILSNKNMKKKFKFVDNKKPSYLIADIKKIKKTGWKPKKNLFQILNF